VLESKGREKEPWKFMLYRQYFDLEGYDTYCTDAVWFEIKEPYTKNDVGLAFLRATGQFNTIVLSYAIGFPLAGPAKERECLELDSDPYRLLIRVDKRVRSCWTDAGPCSGTSSTTCPTTSWSTRSPTSARRSTTSSAP
jgi:hypothetical protein